VISAFKFVIVISDLCTCCNVVLVSVLVIGGLCKLYLSPLLSEQLVAKLVPASVPVIGLHSHQPLHLCPSDCSCPNYSLHTNTTAHGICYVCITENDLQYKPAGEFVLLRIKYIKHKWLVFLRGFSGVLISINLIHFRLNLKEFSCYVTSKRK